MGHWRGLAVAQSRGKEQRKYLFMNLLCPLTTVTGIAISYLYVDVLFCSCVATVLPYLFYTIVDAFRSTENLQ